MATKLGWATQVVNGGLTVAGRWTADKANELLNALNPFVDEFNAHVADSTVHGGGGAIPRTNVIASIPANVWTPFPAFTGITNVYEFEIQSSTGQVITEALEFRATSTSYEIFSLVTLTNIQIKAIGI